jgi:Peptidase family M23
MLKKVIGIIVCVLLLYVLYTYHFKPGANTNVSPVTTLGDAISPTSAPTPSPTVNTEWQFPISNGDSRVTKKPFGIYVTKASSPVQPEKFSGYHTGVDFEVSDDEQDSDVEITAICNGPIVLKKWANGYGGVVVQKCKLAGSDVTVIYGHLNIDSVRNNPPAGGGDELKVGDVIGILGKAYSTETDGERKHLHLGIHKGSSINILGYVQNKVDLQNWLDAMTILK